MARLGRAQRARAFTAGPNLPLGVRAGALTGSGGGTAALSVAAVQNLVENATFSTSGMAGWGTSGFSLVSGASTNTGGGFIAAAADSGVNYPPTANLTTFLAGTRYYASVKVRSAFAESCVVELVLGSTSDDYASAQVTTTGSYQTLTVSWVPQQDRAATDHGLAVRYKSGGFFLNFDIDDASIATADGAFWSGWRVGGKKTSAGLTVSTGGGATLTARKADTGALTASAGGGGTLTGRKGGLAALAPSTGGSGTLTVTGAHSEPLTGSGGGTGTLTSTSATTASTLPPSSLMGGGGRVGRSHPAGGVVTRGVGATAVSLFERAGALTGSAGGSSTLSGVKAARLTATTSAGAGPATTTVVKGGRGALAPSAGGTGTLSGAKTPETGGVFATFLMGGGGRIGRSHPAPAVTSRPVVALAASNPEARAGSITSTAGGGGTLAGRKGGVSTTPVAIPAPPPVFVQVLAVSGVRASADGSFTYSYTRTAQQFGSVNASAGGSGTFTARKAVPGALTASCGGSATLTVRKGARSALTGSAGGSLTYSYTRFEARTGSLASSGGGGATLRAAKGGNGALTASAGGGATLRVPKGALGALTASAGGTGTITYTVGGLAAVGVLVGHGGGNGTLTASRTPGSSLRGSAGGTGAVVSASKGGTGRLTTTAGGTGTFTRLTGKPPLQGGIVRPRQYRQGRVRRDGQTDRPLVLRR